MTGLDPIIGRGSTVAVTGGAGFIGCHLVQALIEREADVVVIDSAARTPSYFEQPRYINADVRDLPLMVEVLSDADVVLHLAGNSSTTLSIQDPLKDLSSNSGGTLSVLEACRINGTGRIVYVSSASVYGEPSHTPTSETDPTHPRFPYGISKLTGEHYCRAYADVYSTPVVIARPFCVYGPGENPAIALVEVSRYLRWFLSRQVVPMVGNAKAKTRDFIHVHDVVQALLLLAAKGTPGRAYNVGSGSETSMQELIDIIMSVGNSQAVVKEDRSELLDTFRLVADIDRLRRLGFVPKVGLHEGVAALARWLGARPQPPSTPTLLRAGTDVVPGTGTLDPLWQ